MPVSVVESSAGVHAALRDSIANSSSGTQQCNNTNQKSINSMDDNENFQNKLIASGKKILLSNIEYEEVNNYDQSILDKFKTKYTLFKPLGGKLINPQNDESGGIGNDKNPNQNSTSTNNSGKSVHNNHYHHHQQHQHQQNGPRNPNELPKPKRILYPREKVQIGWRSTGRKWQVGAGMTNVGNTCYLNSTLQAVFHVPAMANWLISDSDHRDRCENENGSQDGCIICAMSKTLIISQTNQSSIRPQMVYSRLKSICKHLVYGRQEDAHEFLRYLVEAMEKSYLHRFRNYKELDQYSKETTPLNQILGGYLKTAVHCLSCAHVSTTFQHFQDLLLDIRKPNTVEEALDGYFGRERLEDMGYKCESCKKKVSATKQFSLERAPISLCIQLKRFSMVGTKINKHIAIRPRLDLSKYTSKRNGEVLTYKLVAMVTHLGGTQTSGHYTAIGLTEQGGYYQFDDNCVRPISLQNVLNTNAYIIFYEMDDSQQNKPASTQVSGDHEKLKNNCYINNNNENIQNNQQKQSPFGNNSNSQNNTHHSYNNTKIMSKLDNGQNNNHNNFNYYNNNRVIGPHLPETSKNGYIPSGQFANALAGPSGYNGNKSQCSPSKIFKPNENNTMPNSSKLSTNSSKLVIHFKNGNSTNTAVSSTSTSNGNNYNNNNCTNSETGSNGFFNGNNKFQESNCTKFGTKIKSTFETENNRLENDIINNDKRLTLPSMPKLEANDNTTTTTSFSTNQQTTPTKTFLPWKGPLSPNAIMRQNLQNNNNGDKKFSNQNGYNNMKHSPIKSLVPYESDGGDDSNDSNGNECIIYNDTKNDDCILLNNNSTTTSVGSKRKFDDSSSLSPDSSPEIKHSKSTTPSPPIVKTKVGLWQVTPIVPQNSYLKQDNKIKEERKNLNPFNTTDSRPISTLNFYSGKQYNNNNNKHQFKKDDCSVTTELLKYSHRGYGAPVLNWNGQKTEMELQMNEEIRLDRKRQIQEEDEIEMDSGRQKKIKIHSVVNRNDITPGYNPFQEQQRQQNNQQNRHRWINNKQINGKPNTNNMNRYHQQNNMNYNRHNNNNFNNRNHNNNNNNFFRRHNNNNNKKFQRNQQRSNSNHHQRNNNGNNGGWR